MLENEESLNIEQRHKKERKDLQAKIQSLKKSVGKGDKKKKKEVLDEIIKLETELEARHLSELSLNGSEESKVSLEAVPNNSSDAFKMSKAQKRRDKKSAQEKARLEMINKQEEENINGPRNLETKAIKKILFDKNLMLHSIPSNGDCLYGAISHQLGLKNICKSVAELRQLTAHHIKQEKANFLPFLTDLESQEMLNDEEFDKYCDNIENSKCWGGQVELQALSEILKNPIHVIQSTPPHNIVQGEQFQTEPLIITYHRHMYGLGEHYNSTKQIVEEDEEST